MFKTYKIILILVVVLIGAGYWKYYRHSAKVSQTVTMQDATSSPDSALNKNTQSSTSSEETLERPLAVVIDNQVDARPQSGLADADMVVETLAEGGITRYLAIYQTKSVSNIGPVRSARTYFADIADELGAALVHVGGNSDALLNIKNGVYKHILDIDQFFYDPYFWRVKTKPMPHNVYTSTDKLSRLARANLSPSFPSVQIGKLTSAPISDALPQATTVKIDFSQPSYAASYAYDAETRLYKRSLAGKPHRDADTGKQITAKNIVVQYVNTFPVKSDTPFAIGMTLVGSGKAQVFMDGKIIEGTWNKESLGRTAYFDTNGKEILFKQGTTWLEIVPDDGVKRVIWQ